MGARRAWAWRGFAVACVAAALVAVPGSSVAAPALSLPTGTSLASFATTNGEVDAAVVHGTTLYIGGQFTAVGPETGSFAQFATSSGDAATLPAIDGRVNAVVADGSGGWFVGGKFTTVGGTAQADLAHITSGGTLDTSFAPSPNKEVDALAISSDHSTLYVGGQFTSIGGQSRNYVAALSTADGTATSFNPSPNNYPYMRAMALSPDGSTLYVGGYFTSIGGQSRNLLAGVSTSTGNATGFNPGPNGGINAIAVSPDGNTVYVGGGFGAIGGNGSRSSLAALSASDGTATSFDAGLPYGSTEVSSLALSSDGSTLYVGGAFSTIGSGGGQSRHDLAALSTADASATSFNPGVDQEPSALALSSDGSTLYAGGSFNTIGGQTRNYLASVSTSDGSATSFSTTLDNGVTAIALSSDGSALGVGGYFNSNDAVTRNQIAAVDLTTGEVTSFDPNADGTVHALAVSPDGSTLYAGGEFSNIGGQSRSYLAGLSTADGTATSFAPQPDSNVYALALSSDGSTLYTGGDFGFIGGQSLDDLAAVATADGTATAFAPNANNTVYSLALSPDGSTLYAGGSFHSLGGQSRNYFGAVSTSTGNATSFHPSVDDDVLGLAVSSDGSAVYGGWNGHIAGFATSDGTATFSDTATWGSFNFSASTYALALSPDDSTLYAGGEFTSVGGQSAKYLAALSTADGTVSSFDAGVDNDVYSLAYDSGSLYAGGDFTVAGSLALNGLARFPSPPAISLTSHPDAGTHSTSASFSFSSTAPGATFRCKLGDGSYASCTSPQGYSGLGLGSHMFTVEASVGSVTSTKSYTWSVVSADGSGTLTTPTSVVSAGQKGRTLSFKYTAASGGLYQGSLTLQVPSGWTAPQHALSSAAGYVTASAGSVAVSGRTITVSGVTRSAGQTVTITYKAATASSTVGLETWTAKERSLTTGTLTSLHASPRLTVYAKDGSGSTARTPASVLHHTTGKTVTLTYTVASGGMHAGTLTVVVPSGWSAPQKTHSTAAGYTSASAGTVSISGRTITVSGLTKTAGQTVRITFAHASAPATAVGNQTWAVKERSTLAGLLTALATSPVIKIT